MARKRKVPLQRAGKSARPKWEDVEPTSGNIWNPTRKGETLEGTVLVCEKVNTRIGPNRILRLRTSDGEEAAVWVSVMLSRFAHIFAPGNIIRITCTGFQDTGKPSEMKLFDVQVAKPYKTLKG